MKVSFYSAVFVLIFCINASQDRKNKNPLTEIFKKTLERRSYRSQKKHDAPRQLIHLPKVTNVETNESNYPKNSLAEILFLHPSTPNSSKKRLITETEENTVSPINKNHISIYQNYFKRKTPTPKIPENEDCLTPNFWLKERKLKKYQPHDPWNKDYNYIPKVIPLQKNLSLGKNKSDKKDNHIFYHEKEPSQFLEKNHVPNNQNSQETALPNLVEISGISLMLQKKESKESNELDSLIAILISNIPEAIIQPEK